MKRLFAFLLVVLAGMPAVAQTSLETRKVFQMEKLAAKAQVSYSGKEMAAIDTDGKLYWWKLDGKDAKPEVLYDPKTSPGEARATHVNFSSKNGTLVVCTQDSQAGAVYIWRNGKHANTRGSIEAQPNRPVSAIAVNTDATAVYFQQTTSPDYEEYQKKHYPTAHDPSKPWLTIISGYSLVAKTDPFTLNHWGSQSKYEPINFMVLSPSGKHAITAGDTGVNVWNGPSTNTGRHKKPPDFMFESPFPATVAGLVDEDEPTIAMDGLDKFGSMLIGTWIEEGKKSRWFPYRRMATFEPTEDVFEVKSHSLTFSPNSKLVAVAQSVQYASKVDVVTGTTQPSASYEVRLWNVTKQNDSQSIRLQGHESEILEVKFLDDNTLATITKDGTIGLWDVKSHTRKFMPQKGTVLGFSISRNPSAGRAVMAVTMTDKIILLDGKMEKSSPKVKEKPSLATTAKK